MLDVGHELITGFVCVVHTKTGSWRTCFFTKCPRVDKQKSVREEKKSLRLVGKRAQIPTGGIRAKEMRKVHREGEMKRERAEERRG